MSGLFWGKIWGSGIWGLQFHAFGFRVRDPKPCCKGRLTVQKAGGLQQEDLTA